jgi:hypothetical protein
MLVLFAHDQIFKGNFFEFFLFMYAINHFFICRPSYSTVSEYAGIEFRTVATLALTARPSNVITRLDIIKSGQLCFRERTSVTTEKLNTTIETIENLKQLK